MIKLHAPEEHALSNGIPVIFQHFEGPVAATYWWNCVGSADETKPEAGFAHFLEHMLFKDTAAKETGMPSSGQTARAIESLGGDVNAYTSFDQTVYHVTCAEQHWEKIIDVFGKMAKPQKFLKSDFDREREVILEELRKNEDSPSRQLFQSLFSGTFNRHPYGKPVIGYRKTLNAATVKNLEAFYNRNYISGNMGLILVGPLKDEKDTRKKAILRKLEGFFGSKVYPKKLGTRASRVLEPALRKQAEFNLKPFSVQNPSAAFSFRVPDLLHADIPALDVLSGVVGMGEVSRLYQKLFYQTSMVTDSSAGLYVPRDPGMFYFELDFDNSSKVETAVKESFSILNEVLSKGPTDQELQRIIVNSESEKYYATQSADGLAGRLGFLKFVVGDLNFDQRYLEQLKGMGAKEVQEVAQRYFDFNRMAGVVMVPKAEGDFDLKPIAEAAKKTFTKKDLVKKLHKNAKVVKSTGFAVERFQTPSGIKLAYLHRPQSHVCSIHASVFGGARLERDWGLSHILSQTWTKGTQQKTALQIASMVEGKAAHMDGFSGKNSLGLQIMGLERDWNDLSRLFSEVLVEPKFPEPEIEHSRRVSLEAIRSIEDHSSQLCSKLFLETLYESHPYGRNSYGSEESLPKINSSRLQEYLKTWIRPERLVLSISGAVKRDELDRWLADLEIALQKKKAEPAFPDLQIKPETLLKAPRWVEKNLGREQIHILVGSLGLSMYDEDRFALRILQNILGGQSGRLFIELREKKSLAYTVSPLSMEGIEPGYVATYIACSPSKRKEAIQGMKEVLQKLAQKGPTESEMKRAKEFYLGRRAMELQSDSSLAAHFGLHTLYGLAQTEDAEISKIIHSVTAKQVKAVCEKYFVQPFTVTSVVG